MRGFWLAASLWCRCCHAPVTAILLVDIAHIPELVKIDDTGSHIEIGAMVRQAGALLSPMVRSISRFLPRR